MDEAIINQVIDERYLIKERITAGGMAIVYQALDQKTGEMIAIKLLQSSWAEHPDVIDRFEREANIMASLNHPHIVKFIGGGKYTNRPYIAMEYVSGGSLSDLLKQVAHINLKGTERLLQQIASALDYAHGKQVVHRDLKPGNILLSDEKHASLTDFGIARVLEHTSITLFGQMPGTPQYMSPEQANGLVDDIDRLSDIYSLAIIAYLLSTGRLPFSGSEPMAIMNAHITQDPPRPTDVNDQLPTAINDVLLKGLKKRKSERYQTAMDFVQDYEKAIRGSEDLEVIIKVRKKLPSLPDGVTPTRIFSDDAEVKTHVATQNPIPRMSQQNNRVFFILAPIMIIIILILVFLVLNNDGNASMLALPEQEETNVALSRLTQTEEQADIDQTRTREAVIQAETNVARDEIQATQDGVSTEQANNITTSTAEAIDTLTAEAEQEIIGATMSAESIIAQQTSDAIQNEEATEAQETGVAIALDQTATASTATSTITPTATLTQTSEPTVTMITTDVDLTVTPTIAPYTNEDGVTGVLIDLLDNETLSATEINCPVFASIYEFIEEQLDDDNEDFMVLDSFISLSGQQSNLEDDPYLSRLYNAYCYNDVNDEIINETITIRDGDTTLIIDLRLALQTLQTEIANE